MLPFGFHTPEIVILLPLILWFWALVDCIKNRGLTTNQKIIWFLLIFFTHFIGAIIYFVAKRSHTQQRMQSGNTHYYPEQATPYYRPFQSTLTDQQPYAGYAEGYRRQDPVSYEAERREPEHNDQPSPYDQPLATYPEQQQQ